MIPARRFDFDTTVGAIGSNEPKWSCNDVVLMFERPEECEREEVDAFMEFFEPPFGMLLVLLIWIVDDNKIILYTLLTLFSSRSN